MNGPRVRSRSVDTRNGRKVFAYACGDWACLDARFQGRLVDSRNGRPVYAIASECRHPEPYQPIHFVEKECFPPFGVSNRIKVRLHAVHGCPDLDCIDFDIEYDPSTRKWRGSHGTLSVEVWCATGSGTGSFGGELLIKVYGCVAVPETIAVIPGCVYPLTAELPSTKVLSGCCECAADHTFSIELLGYTFDRYIGRLVDVRNGRKVYAVSECCTPCEPSPQDCCDLHEGCTLVLSAESGTGGCALFAGTHNMCPMATPTPTWENCDTINAGNSTWTLHLECRGDPGTGTGSTGTTQWYLLVTGVPNPPLAGCFCSGEAFALTDSRCNPLEIQFTVPIACTPTGGATCCNATMLITVTL